MQLVREGIDNLLVVPLDREDRLKITKWFLQEIPIIYAKEFIKNDYNYIKQIHKDLEQIITTESEAIYLQKTSVLHREAWLPITKQICEIVWSEQAKSASLKSGDVRLPKLKGLADFFYKLDRSEYNSGRIAALLYQLSQGDVPNEVWERCQFGKNDILPNSGDKNTKDRALLYGLKIDRHIRKAEQAQRFAVNVSTWVFRQLGKPIPKTPTYFQSLIALALVFWLGNLFKPFSNFSLPNLINLGSINQEQEFKKTIKALDSIEKEMADKLPITSLQKPTLKPNQIIRAETVKLISGESNQNLDFNNRVRDSQQWKKSVKQYQEKLIADYGYKTIQTTGNFETGDDTDKVLRCAIGKRLGISLDNICTEKFSEYISKITNKFDWDITKKSLEQLRNEFVKNHKLNISVVEVAISKVLFIPDGEAFLKNDTLWVKHIREFQTNRIVDSSSTGVIYPPNSKASSPEGKSSSNPSTESNNNSDTYDVLKCSLAKELNKKLKEKPLICKAIPDFKDI
jgi:hypothetical protein